MKHQQHTQGSRRKQENAILKKYWIRKLEEDRQRLEEQKERMRKIREDHEKKMLEINAEAQKRSLEIMMRMSNPELWLKQQKERYDLMRPDPAHVKAILEAAGGIVVLNKPKSDTTDPKDYPDFEEYQKARQEELEKLSNYEAKYGIEPLAENKTPWWKFW